MRLYVVVDMQNDFIDGALKNDRAKAIVPPMSQFLNKIKSDKDNIIVLTRDTHFDDYLTSYEGKHLPIPHCLYNTYGWNVNQTLIDALSNDGKLTGNVSFVNKMYFNAGEQSWLEKIKSLRPKGNDYLDFKEIVLMGTCTDICVISNAFALKAICPNVDIVILDDLCAGLTKEKHDAALEVMKSCQMIVMNSKGYLDERKSC